MGEILWVTGPRQSGKTAWAKKLYGRDTILIDRESIEPCFSHDVTSAWDNCMTIAKLAKMLAEQERLIVIAYSAPSVKIRREIKKIIPNCTFFEMRFNYENDPEYEEAWDAHVIIEKRVEDDIEYDR